VTFQVGHLAGAEHFAVLPVHHDGNDFAVVDQAVNFDVHTVGGPQHGRVHGLALGGDFGDRAVAAAEQVERADTPTHQARLREVESQLVQRGAPSRGRIYRELSDGSASSTTLDRALVRCALESYRAHPAVEEGELIGAVTLALQRQAGGSEGIWDDLQGMELKLWRALACRVWPGLTPAQQRALVARSPAGALPKDASAPQCATSP